MSSGSDHPTDSTVHHCFETRSDFCGNQLNYYEQWGSHPEGFEYLGWNKMDKGAHESAQHKDVSHITKY